MKRVLLFILSTLSFQFSQASEVSDFRAEWCAQNQILFSKIKIVCYGESQVSELGTTRSILIQKADGVKELFIESDFTSIDLFNLEVTVMGPVATNQPRDLFAAKYTGTVKLRVDQNGEVYVADGFLFNGEKFFAVREN